MKFFLKTPEEVAKELSIRLKQIRLSKKWKRSTLSERSGVSGASLRRFESTGKISLNNFLKLMFSLERLDEIQFSRKRIWGSQFTDTVA
ncbi:transcriptional regulator, partial [Candidatus Magnetomorum sp. HK-1]